MHNINVKVSKKGNQVLNASTHNTPYPEDTDLFQKLVELLESDGYDVVCSRLQDSNPMEIIE